MTPPRILIAGIGNIFLGDDAFGCVVVRELIRRPLPDGVQIMDFGIRGMDLALATLQGYDFIVMVDAVPRQGTPGTLYVIQPEVTDTMPEIGMPLIDMHSLDPVRVLRLAKLFGGRTDHVVVVGCEPTVPESDQDLPEGLSQPVAAAVAPAVDLVENVVTRLRFDPRSLQQPFSSSAPDEDSPRRLQTSSSNGGFSS